MKYSKRDLNIKKGIQKEWIITNGIGGYASSTIIGANTRKYHGLLVAPLIPPAKRFLILSKVDESVEILENKYNLYTNMCRDYISDGYKYLESFEKDYIPTFKYNIEGMKIEKTICMQYKKNTVVVLYHIINIDKPAKLTIAPLINFRDFHTINSNHKFEVEQKIEENKIKIILDSEKKYPIYMKTSDGNYIKHENDRFNNMYYEEEEKRGFFPEENHSVPGRFEINIKPNEEKFITFICSLEKKIDDIDGMEIINSEIGRINKEIEKSELLEFIEGKEFKNNTISKEELVKKYIIASDNFISYRPSFKLHTLLAGYPWFLDWGRDTLISFEGILLISKRFKIAKEVLLTVCKDSEDGLVPNGYSGFDNRPLYNSVDSGLLLFEQVNKYIRYTNDYKFVREKIYSILEKIIDAYKTGIDIDNNNIYLDTDNLIVSGTRNTQNTWMDAKIGHLAITPRNGKAVEINAMWYNALMIMSNLSNKFDKKAKSNKYLEMAKETKKSFEEKFYNPEKHCLYDVLEDSKIRPNQLFALSMSYPVIDPSSNVAKEILDTVTKKLLNNYGLKTLAKGEEKYVEIYEGDSTKRDMSYHQGITWPWLLGLYNDALKNIIRSHIDENQKKVLNKTYCDFINNVQKTFINELEKGKTVGSISELYDSKKPYESKGAFAQCWSVAEIFRIIFETFNDEL